MWNNRNNSVKKKNSFKLFKLTKFHSNMFVWPYFPPLVPCCVFFLYIDSHCNKWCLFVFNIVQLRPIFLYAFWCNSECEGVVVHVVKNTLGVVGLPTWPFLFVKCVIKIYDAKKKHKKRKENTLYHFHVSPSQWNRKCHKGVEGYSFPLHFCRWTRS